MNVVIGSHNRHYGELATRKVLVEKIEEVDTFLL